MNLFEFGQLPDFFVEHSRTPCLDEKPTRQSSDNLRAVGCQTFLDAVLVGLWDSFEKVDLNIRSKKHLNI